MAASGFWDRISNRYAKSPVSNQEAYQKKLEVTRAYLKPDMEVHEFGCGTGSTAIVHAPFVKHILAIDFSQKMLAIARAKAEATQIRNIEFGVSGIEEFSPPSSGYDVVMRHSILHLLKDRQAVISKVFNMLKPGGVFVSSTTCMGGGFSFMKLLLPVGHALGLLPLVRFFSVDDLVTDVKAAGFEIAHQWQPEGADAVFLIARKPG